MLWLRVGVIVADRCPPWMTYFWRYHVWDLVIGICFLFGAWDLGLNLIDKKAIMLMYRLS